MIVFRTLSFCAGCAALVVLSACVGLFLTMFMHVTVDTNLVQLLTTILYTSAFVATSIIGSYVFGANFDYADARHHASSLLSTSTEDDSSVS